MCTTTLHCPICLAPHLEATYEFGAGLTRVVLEKWNLGPDFPCERLFAAGFVQGDTLDTGRDTWVWYDLLFDGDQQKAIHEAAWYAANERADGMADADAKAGV